MKYLFSCHKPPLIFFIEEIYFLPRHHAGVHESHPARLAAGAALAPLDSVDHILSPVLPCDPAGPQKPLARKFRQHIHIDLGRVDLFPVSVNPDRPAAARALLRPLFIRSPCRLHAIASQGVPADIRICMRHLICPSFYSKLTERAAAKQTALRAASPARYLPDRKLHQTPVRFPLSK